MQSCPCFSTRSGEKAAALISQSCMGKPPSPSKWANEVKSVPRNHAPSPMLWSVACCGLTYLVSSLGLGSHLMVTHLPYMMIWFMFLTSSFSSSSIASAFRSTASFLRCWICWVSLRGSCFFRSSSICMRHHKNVPNKPGKGSFCMIC